MANISGRDMVIKVGATPTAVASCAEFSFEINQDVQKAPMTYGSYPFPSGYTGGEVTYAGTLKGVSADDDTQLAAVMAAAEDASATGELSVAFEHLGTAKTAKMRITKIGQTANTADGRAVEFDASAVLYDVADAA